MHIAILFIQIKIKQINTYYRRQILILFAFL